VSASVDLRAAAWLAHRIEDSRDITLVETILRGIAEDGLVATAEEHGWCETCGGRREVKRHAVGCLGGACPCAEVPCPECSGPEERERT